MAWWSLERSKDCSKDDLQIFIEFERSFIISGCPRGATVFLVDKPKKYLYFSNDGESVLIALALRELKFKICPPPLHIDSAKHQVDLSHLREEFFFQ